MRVTGGNAAKEAADRPAAATGPARERHRRVRSGRRRAQRARVGYAAEARERRAAELLGRVRRASRGLHRARRREGREVGRRRSIGRRVGGLTRLLRRARRTAVGEAGRRLCANGGRRRQETAAELAGEERQRAHATAHATAASDRAFDGRRARQVAVRRRASVVGRREGSVRRRGDEQRRQRVVRAVRDPRWSRGEGRRQRRRDATAAETAGKRRRRGRNDEVLRPTMLVLVVGLVDRRCVRCRQRPRVQVRVVQLEGVLVPLFGVASSVEREKRAAQGSLAPTVDAFDPRRRRRRLDGFARRERRQPLSRGSGRAARRSKRRWREVCPGGEGRVGVERWRALRTQRARGGGRSDGAVLVPDRCVRSGRA